MALHLINPLLLKRSRDFRRMRENQTSWQVILVRATVSGTSDAYACTKRKRAASVEFFFNLGYEWYTAYVSSLLLREWNRTNPAND